MCLNATELMILLGFFFDFAVIAKSIFEKSGIFGFDGFDDCLRGE